ncbi:MAG: hypothetical protein J0L62_03270 [Bacteroidetes bacterium]|nr:hypothetical protein [Bacteroidota bacterium]
MTSFSTFRIAISVLFVFTLIAGCKDNSVDDDHNEEHAEVGGAAFNASGNRLVTYWDTKVKGQFEVPQGSVSPIIEITFLSDLDSSKVADTHTEELTLKLTVADTSVAVATVAIPAGFLKTMHEDDYAMTIRGKKAGSTTLKVSLLHGGHPDFETIEIPLIVK